MTFLPNPSVRAIDPSTGLLSRDWYAYFRDLRTAAAGGSASALQALQTALHDLSGVVENLQEPSIFGVASVRANGGYVQLQNDADTPGPLRHYATDENGDRGWQAIKPRALPLVTGELVSGQPVFMCADNGSLIYAEFD